MKRVHFNFSDSLTRRVLIHAAIQINIFTFKFSES